MAEFTHFGRMIDMWMSILCPVLKNGWYKPDCLMGQCGDVARICS